MFSSTFFMEDQNTKYIVPLDAIDLAYLPVRRKYGANDETVPLWRKESRDMYLEFEVVQVDNEHEPAVNETRPNEEELHITTYLKILRALTKTPQTLKLIAFDDDTIVIHVQNKKLYVSVNNFHGYAKSGDETLCRVCRVVTGQKDAHMLSEKHMEIVSTYIPDVNCIRKVDQLWSHCILCNEIIENKEFHITCSYEHQLRLRDALCSTPVTNKKNKPTLQSRANGLPKLDIAQNNNVVSSFNMTNNKKESQPTLNSVQSNSARISNNINNRQSNVSTSQKSENIQAKSKMESPKSNVKLKPGMVYCDVCDRIMHSNNLKSHQGGNEHKYNLTNFKKNQEQEVKKPVNNITPKLTETIKENSNVCFCGTVFLSIYHKRTHFSGETHQDYLAKQKIEKETAKKETNNLKTVNAGTSNDKTHFNSKNNAPIVKPYRTLPNRQVFCNVCNFKMHENDLQSHLKGRNHADNAFAKDTKIAQNTENTSFKTVQNTENKTSKTVQNKANKSCKTVMNTENIPFKIDQNTENNSYKTIKITENYKTENNDIPLYKNKVMEKKFFFYNSKNTITDCSVKNKEPSIQTNREVHPETSNAAVKEKSNVNENSSGKENISVWKYEYPRGNENILILKQADDSTKKNINGFEVQSKGDIRCSMVMFDEKVALEQKQEAVDDKIRNLVAKKRDIEIKEPYKIETILLTNIPEGKVDVKPTNTGTSMTIGENQEHSNKEQYIAENIKNLVERKYNIKVIEKRNYDVLKNDKENNSENKPDNPKIESKLQLSNTEDITERIKNLVSRKVDINTVKKKDVFSNTVVLVPQLTQKHSHELDMETNTKKYATISKKPTISQKTKALENETNRTPLNSIETVKLEKTGAKQDIDKTNIIATLNNITEMLQNGTEITQMDTKINQKDTKITHNDTKMTLNKTEVTQNKTEITQKGTKITHEDTKMTQNDTEITQNEKKTTQENTEMTTLNDKEINKEGTIMTPGLTKKREIASAKEMSPAKRSFTDKLRTLVTRTQIRNTFDESLSISISESELSEQTEPATKQEKKLDLATRLRNFVARERAKRKNGKNEDNKRE